MRVPYSIQGALFAPVFIGLSFILKISCPADSSGMCFADLFMPVVFYPVRVLGVFQNEFIYSHEPFFILLYWMIVGFLFGTAIDMAKDAFRKSERNSNKPVYFS